MHGFVSSNLQVCVCVCVCVCTRTCALPNYILIAARFTEFLESLTVGRDHSAQLCIVHCQRCSSYLQKCFVCNSIHVQHWELLYTIANYTCK